MLIDLQLHSYYSDGYFSPVELASLMSRRGIKVASLTDHNTVAGLREFRQACGRYGIKPITGLELYVTFGGRKFNLLWYAFDDGSPELHHLLRESQLRRRRQVRIGLKQLAEKKFIFNADEILDKFNYFIPLNRLIDEIMAGPTNRQIINKYSGSAHPREEDFIYYLHKNNLKKILMPSYLDFSRIIKLRRRIGGYLVLCHPAKNGYISRDFWKKLKNMGLDGVEKLSPHHSYGAIVYIQHLSKEIDLIETGGSDFHRMEGGRYPVSLSWDYFKIDSAGLRGVKKIIG